MSLYTILFIILSICLVHVMITYIMYYNRTSYTDVESLSSNNGNVGIISMIKSPKNIDLWLDKHRNIGIKHFYIRLEDTPELEVYLSEQPDVTLQVGKSEGVNEYKNIQNRQNTWINECIRRAEIDNNNLRWLFHIDADEIIRGDLSELDNYGDDVRTVWIQNEEAKFSRVPKREDSCFEASRMVNCEKESGKCVSYVNGKSCGRVAPDVEAFGPHRMQSKLEKESIKHPTIFVEHYESCDFEIYKDKFKRLSTQNKDNKIPFSYYNESIQAAQKNDENELYKIYAKYRVEYK